MCPAVVVMFEHINTQQQRYQISFGICYLYGDTRPTRITIMHKKLRTECFSSNFPVVDSKWAQAPCINIVVVCNFILNYI